MPKLTRVLATDKAGTGADGAPRVAFSEEHPDHPGGSAFVSAAKVGDGKGGLKDPEPVEIAKTAAAQKAIADGYLEEVDEEGEERPRRRSQARAAEPAESMVISEPADPGKGEI